MKKIILLLIAIIMLCGCGRKIDDIEIEENNNLEGNMTMMTYCDKKYNVEYIIIWGYYKAGISIRLDENGNIIHCVGSDK